MRLISCHIENFGKLSQLDLDFSHEIHSVYEKNGWGKSTLAAFLKIMFYGFENERSRDGYQNERRRYQPWQGGVYGGTLTFEVKGVRYHVSRSFGQREKEDTFSLREAETNLISHEYSKDLGEELFHIDRASFERTLFISQNDCETETTDRIYAKIGNLTEASHDMSDYEKADSRLHDLLNAMSPVRKTGSLYRMEEKMYQLETEVRRKEGIKQELSAFEKERNRIKQEEVLLEKQIKRLKEERERTDKKEKLPERKDVNHMLEQCMKLAADEHGKNIYTLTREEKERYEQITDRKEEIPQRKKEFPLLFIFGFLLTLFGAGLFYQGRTEGGILLAIGIAALLCACVRSFYQSQSTRPNEFHEEEIERLKAKQKLFKEASYAYETGKKEIEAYLVRYERVPEENLQKQLLMMLEEIDRYEDEISERKWKESQAENQLELCRQKMWNLKQRTEKETAVLEDILEKETQLYELKEQYCEDFMKYEQLKTAREYLGKAKEAFMNKYKNPLMEAFSYYYQLMTGEISKDCYLDANITLTRMEAGDQRAVRYYSAGWKDLMGICMRMAFLEAMYKEEKPFLIFDDPFVNLDSEKVKAGLSFLKKIGKEYQIIYFTCHDSRKL